MTRDLLRRAYQHKTRAAQGFTFRYNVHLLVWFETFDDPLSAIAREKEIKKWRSRMEDKLDRTIQPWMDRSLRNPSFIKIDPASVIPGPRDARSSESIATNPSELTRNVGSRQSWLWIPDSPLRGDPE
ncbi:MAG TPA: GIY-YIG nuclease family protein [Rhizomicrobium sp.]|nr:GIY-YIG nuclease family protein [Rhizomicrobium sp.]